MSYQRFGELENAKTISDRTTIWKFEDRIINKHLSSYTIPFDLYSLHYRLVTSFAYRYHSVTVYFSRCPIAIWEMWSTRNGLRLGFPASIIILTLGNVLNLRPRTVHYTLCLPRALLSHSRVNDGPLKNRQPIWVRGRSTHNVYCNTLVYNTFPHPRCPIDENAAKNRSFSLLGGLVYGLETISGEKLAKKEDKAFSFLKKLHRKLF